MLKRHTAADKSMAGLGNHQECSSQNSKHFQSAPTRWRSLQGKVHCQHWGQHAGRRRRELQLPKAWKPARGGQHMSLTMCCAMCPTPGLKQSASGSRLLHKLCDSLLGAVQHQTCVERVCHILTARP